MTLQKEYKDRLFTFIFGSNENRAWTLSLYNAVNGSNYTDPSKIEITTIKEVLYLGMHNDVSFIIDNQLSLYEQQSSYNPNMPLRLLQYVGNIFEAYVKKERLNKYGATLIKLPVPKFVVFYNGKDEEPDEKFLKLSDAFPEGAKADIEVTVKMLNINFGHNKDLARACKPLMEYSWIIEKIRENSKSMSAEEAVNKVISEMPSDFILKPFLEIHQAEVKGMLLTEYNETEAMNLFKEEGRVEGRKEGRKEGIFDTLFGLVKKGLLSIDDAAEQAGVSKAKFQKLMAGA